MDTNHTINQYREALRRLWGNYQMVVSANPVSRKWGVALIISRDIGPNDLAPHHMVPGRVLGVEVAFGRRHTFTESAGDRRVWEQRPRGKKTDPT